MYDLISTFQSLNMENIVSVIGWMVVSYAAVLGATMVDLGCGLYKAIKAGRATTSTGLRKTCAKAQHYFLPMICLTFGDFLAATLMSFPPFTMLWSSFCIICEFKSVLENTTTKEHMREAAETMNVVIKNKDDLAKVLLEVMKQANKEDLTK